MKLSNKIFLVIFVTILICSCKKEPSTYHISGKLLFSRTMPFPVSNYYLDFYQMGSAGGIIGGSRTSNKSTTTTSNGVFDLDFQLGSSYFMGLQGANNNPVHVSGPFPNYSQYPTIGLQNFPVTEPDSFKVIYLCKKVDTVIIHCMYYVAVKPTDTFVIGGYCTSGTFEHIKTGLSFQAKEEFDLDTVYNAVFSSFDYKSRKYFSSSSCNVTFNGSSRTCMPDSLNENDESKIVLQN